MVKKEEFQTVKYYQSTRPRLTGRRLRPAVTLTAADSAALHSQPSPVRINIEGRAPQKSSSALFSFNLIRGLMWA